MNWPVLYFLTFLGFLETSWCRLQVIQSWKTFDFVFDNDTSRESMIESGRFIPKNVLATDFDIWQEADGKTKLFVALPKLKKGIPAALATVEADGRLMPYPDWSWHNEEDPQMTTVFSIKVDECDRLWVLDSGKRNPTSNETRKPQIFAFDLKSDELIGTFLIPNALLKPTSVLATIEIDARGSTCDINNTFAYIADSAANKLIVYDIQNSRSWKINSNYFYPDPLYGSFDVSGVNFYLMAGIYGLAIGPLRDDERLLYWHSFSSIQESWVKTSVIRNNSLFLTKVNKSPGSFKISTSGRPSQSGTEVMSSDGILFYGLLGNNSIACWNSNKPFSEENMAILETDDVNLQFPSSVKIHKGKLYVMSTRYQTQAAGQFNENEDNYRILSADISEITSGTICGIDQTNSNSRLVGADLQMNMDMNNTDTS